ncbi:MAG TPA: hypothetical protein V6D14_03760 [Coleofasciculaceae cyanobacterium]
MPTAKKVLILSNAVGRLQALEPENQRLKHSKGTSNGEQETGTPSLSSGG